MAHTLALLFHIAAIKHFEDHAPREGEGQCPDIPACSSTDQCQAGCAMGGHLPYGFPLTTPLREGAGSDAWLFWTNGEVQTLQFGERITAVVVDDTSDHDSEGLAHKDP